jgi:NAD(P)-dependent dehydrogenase (short-subunit alcohol dehydrogenase family)
MMFAHKVVIVTGGSTGIGLSTVYITGRRASLLDEAVADLGPKAIPVVSDVAKLDDLRKLRAEVAAQDDRIDVLVANAGVSVRNDLGSTEEHEYDFIFDINVKGLFFTVELLLPLMVDAGAIVLVSSFVANRGRPNLSLYNASKAAVRSFARSFANDLSGRAIRVNAVSPGVIRTDILMNRPGITPEEVAEIGAQIEKYCEGAAPLKRSADPDEVAEPILFLASANASYITGFELGVDGGMGQI